MNAMEIAARCGLTEEETRIYSEYVANAFTAAAAAKAADGTPAGDGGDDPDAQAKAEAEQQARASYFAFWEQVTDAVKSDGAAAVLNRALVAKRPVAFRCPEGISVEMYESCAGRIPVITFADDEDFEAFLTNLLYKGVRPETLGRTGASFVSGKVQRFIVLSSKPYSNVPGAWMGLEEAEWRRRSGVLRREHECTHFYTKSVYGVARNNLHDELMADFFGLVEAMGEYRAAWFEHFMGIDGRPEGRLAVYTKELPEAVVRAVARTGHEAAVWLEEWARSEEFARLSRVERMEVLCRKGLPW